MSSADASHKRLGPFVDDFDDISLGRIVVFMITCAGLLLGLEGGFLALWETIWEPSAAIVNGTAVALARTTNGIQLVGLGAGLCVTAAGLKGWQRMSEAKIANGTQ